MSSSNPTHLGFPKKLIPLAAPFTFKTAIEKLYDGEWRAYGSMDVQAAMGIDGRIDADIAVALLEFCKKSVSSTGYYRVGEIVYEYANGDFVRVA